MEIPLKAGEAPRVCSCFRLVLCQRLHVQAQLPAAVAVAGAWGQPGADPPCCPLTRPLSPGHRGGRRTVTTAAWRLSAAASTRRPSAGCWSPRSRAWAARRSRVGTSPLARRRHRHRSALPPTCRRRPSPRMPSTPPSSWPTTKRRTRTRSRQVRTGPLGGGRAQPPTASSSPAHFGHPRPAPAGLGPGPVRPRPLPPNPALPGPATPEVEVKLGRPSPPPPDPGHPHAAQPL